MRGKRTFAALLAAVMLLACLPAGATELEDYEDEVELRKSELHMAYHGANAANVSYNGCYLNTGPWSPPILMGNRTVALPARGFLWSAGATPKFYRDGHIYLTLTDGSSLEIHDNSPLIEVKKDGKTRTVDMGGPAQPANGDRYVADSSLQAALGCSAAWDYEFAAVHFTDWPAVAAETDRRLGYFNEILSAYEGEKVSLGTRLLGNYPNETVATEGIPPLRRQREDTHLVRTLLGNKAFVVRDMGPTSTYTSEGDAGRLIAWALAEADRDACGQWDDSLLDDLPERLPEVTYKLTFRTYGGDLREARLTGSARPEGGKTRHFSVNFLEQKGDLVANILEAMPLEEWFPAVWNFVT